MKEICEIQYCRLCQNTGALIIPMTLIEFPFDKTNEEQFHFGIVIFNRRIARVDSEYRISQALSDHFPVKAQYTPRLDTKQTVFSKDQKTNCVPFANVSVIFS